MPFVLSSAAAIDESFGLAVAHLAALRIAVDFHIPVVLAFCEPERLDVAQLAAKYEPIIERPAVVDSVREPKCQWNAVKSAKHEPY